MNTDIKPQTRNLPTMTFSLTGEVVAKLRQWPDGMRSLLADAMFREKLGLPPSDRIRAIQEVQRK